MTAFSARPSQQSQGQKDVIPTGGGGSTPTNSQKKEKKGSRQEKGKETGSRDQVLWVISNEVLKGASKSGGGTFPDL